MDFYEVLQVDRRADAEVIQAAYRTLARRHHPDVGGDPGKMVTINEAWAILGNPARRKGYDNTLRRTTAATTGARAAASHAATSVPVTEVPRHQPRPTSPPAAVAGDRVLDFGRYAGWSVNDVSRQDPDYLLWLERTMAGRSLRSEIQRALEIQRGLEMRRGPALAMAAAGSPARPRRGRWFR